MSKPVQNQLLELFRQFIFWRKKQRKFGKVIYLSGPSDQVKRELNFC